MPPRSSDNKFKDAWPDAQAMLTEARARGTHSDQSSTVCEGCGNWRTIYYITFGKLRLCAACADDKAGAGPESFRRRQLELQQKYEQTAAGGKVAAQGRDAAVYSFAEVT